MLVPGHGEPITREFVESQLTEVAFLAETARRTWPELRDSGHDPRGHAPHPLVEETARHLGWPTEPVHAALGRGLAQAAVQPLARFRIEPRAPTGGALMVAAVSCSSVPRTVGRAGQPPPDG